MPDSHDEEPFRQRFWGDEELRPDDERDQYGRDRARIVHSAAFRRLQAKTQVMGVGEGDFHRTRLTHSIEVSQIGEGILKVLERRYQADGKIMSWLPTRDLMLAACCAHDLGHPPFGHGGERALHSRMADCGGFEGNGQTLRILTRLEKYSVRHGINPTRRLILAVLKYPVPYSTFNSSDHRDKPPKCYLDGEQDIVEWALGDPFTAGERHAMTTLTDGIPKHRSLDCSLVECADDIAYVVSDLEDIVARRLVQKEDLENAVGGMFKEFGGSIGETNKSVESAHIELLSGYGSHERKYSCGTLINLFITSAEIERDETFKHPLLQFRVTLPSPLRALLKALKKATFDLVVQEASVQQLERRGQRVVTSIYDALIADPEHLIPRASWDSLGKADSMARRVCDYIAGMTDPYAERIYRRLFVPGFGSSTDEL